jgi:hypothetical protein
MSFHGLPSTDRATQTQETEIITSLVNAQRGLGFAPAQAGAPLALVGLATATASSRPAAEGGITTTAAECAQEATATPGKLMGARSAQSHRYWGLQPGQMPPAQPVLRSSDLAALVLLDNEV